MVVAEAGVPKRFAFGSRDCDLVISDYVFDCKQGTAGVGVAAWVHSED